MSPGSPATDRSGRSRYRRLLRVGAWIAGIGLFCLLLQGVGVDVSGWLSELWHELRSIPASYLVPALVLQLAYTTLAGFSYYGIFRAAYPGEGAFAPILTAYAVGVAMNGFLPASIGTLVTLVMFVSIIPSATFGGSFAAFLVQKIFFTIAGTFVFLYMFLSVPGSFDLNYGRLTEKPLATIGIVVAIAFLILFLVRFFWRHAKKLWDQAKEGGVILSRPRQYVKWVLLPSFLSWLCRLCVTGIFLAAFSIPVTFESIMWVTGSGSLAATTSFTPGAIGVMQATNALALKTCCQVPQKTAVDYSTAQQLITTAWNVLFALILMIVVFGWTGGKQLVGQSYTDAKTKVAEQKAQRRRKKKEANLRGQQSP